MSCSKPPLKPALRIPKLGFLGAGWIGRKRLESVTAAQSAEIMAVADPLADNLIAVREIVPDALQFSSLEELMRLELDGVVIATPSALHADQATAALERGYAVFCQKPLGRSAAEVRTIISAARRADRLLSVDLSYRHCQGLRAIRELIATGDLGRVFAVNLVFHNAYGPDKSWFYDRKLSGGGCVVDLGIHLVDLALWMIPSRVTDVDGVVFSDGEPLEHPPIKAEDYAAARLRTDTGAVIDLSCSWRAHAGKPAIIEASFYGTQGGARWYNIDGSFTEFRADRFSGTSTESISEPPENWGGGAILEWVNRLATRPRFDPCIEEHLKVAEILDAIYGTGPQGKSSAVKKTTQ